MRWHCQTQANINSFTPSCVFSTLQCSCRTWILLPPVLWNVPQWTLMLCLFVTKPANKKQLICFCLCWICRFILWQVLVAAFAVSGYSSTYYRAGSKPFNPLLGETYECIREDKGFCFFSEQVNPHMERYSQGHLLKIYFRSSTVFLVFEDIMSCFEAFCYFVHHFCLVTS